MKLKINQVLQEMDGSPIQVSGKPPMTLKDVITGSLLSIARNPQTGQPEQESEKDKFDKYELVRKIRDKKIEVDLKAEEVALIKKLIGKHQVSPLIVGEAFEMIEGKYQSMKKIDDEQD